MTELKRSAKQSGGKSVADIIGKTVRIPASMYGIDVPGMMYRARIIKKDTSHKNAVVLSFFEDDGSLHWAPADDVRKWLAYPGEGKCTGEESDKYAIETLLQFRGIARNNAWGQESVETFHNDHDANQPNCIHSGKPKHTDAMDVDKVENLKTKHRRNDKNQNLIWKEMSHGVLTKGNRKMKASTASMLARRRLHEGIQKPLAMVLEKHC